MDNIMGVKKIILLFICILLITLAVPSVNASMVSISAQAKYRPGIEVTVNPGYSILNCVLSKYTIAIEEAGPLLKKINKNDAFGPGIDNLVAYTEVTKGNGPGMPFGLCGSRRNGHSGPGRHSRRLTNFALKDALGSVTRLTDSSGRVSHRYFYSPFGKSAGFGNVAGNPFTYTGRRLDPTGLLFYRSRYMIPGTGRFMQADRWGGSVWSPWQSHPFIYVNNNPMVFVDPYGLWSMSLRGVLNYTVGTFDGIGQSLLTIGTTVANNLGTTALVAAGVAAAPNLAIIAGAGMAGLALKDSITEFYERTLKGKDSSRAFGKILVDTAFFYLTAKNVPKAVANLKATMSALRESVKNLKNVLKNGGSVSKLLKITFGHGVRHLKGTGLSQNMVENHISKQIQSQAIQGKTFNNGFWGRVTIDGKTIEYRAFTLSDGTINVGTYYVP
jgi:RHS repeat-associated protein